MVNGLAHDQNEQTSNATVYSFFNRELAPMAKDMVDLLRSCNAWVDPNLVALIPGGAKQGDGEPKRKRRKRNKCSNDELEDVSSSTQKQKHCNTDDFGDVEDAEDVFPELMQNRIVLKRASHVTFSDSEDSGVS